MRAQWAPESTVWSRREARLSQWATVIFGRAEKMSFVMVSAEMGMRAGSYGASGWTAVLSQAQTRHTVRVYNQTNQMIYYGGTYEC